MNASISRFVDIVSTSQSNLVSLINISKVQRVHGSVSLVFFLSLACVHVYLYHNLCVCVCADVCEFVCL